MKPSTGNKTEGKLHQVKGSVKEQIGKATNNADLELSGKVEKNAGKAQGWVGKVEKAIGQ
jgi:uncharacterized protein YjbJ (UPF0337 family)